MRPERLPKEHLAHLQAAHSRLVAAQAAYQMVQATIAEEMGLPDGTQVRLDGTILWEKEATPCRSTISDVPWDTSPNGEQGWASDGSPAPSVEGARKGSSP